MWLGRAVRRFRPYGAASGMRAVGRWLVPAVAEVEAANCQQDEGGDADQQQDGGKSVEHRDSPIGVRGHARTGWRGPRRDGCGCGRRRHRPPAHVPAMPERPADRAHPGHQQRQSNREEPGTGGAGQDRTRTTEQYPHAPPGPTRAPSVPHHRRLGKGEIDEHADRAQRHEGGHPTAISSSTSSSAGGNCRRVRSAAGAGEQ